MGEIEGGDESGSKGKHRLNTFLSQSAMFMLDELAGSERKRGATIEKLIETAYAGQKSNADLRTMDVEALRLMVIGLNGRMQSFEGEMARQQAQVAALIARI